MKRFAYGFGYETPQQRTLNELHGWDDEGSAEIIVRADTAEAAQSWAREVAAASVRYLFEQAGVPERRHGVKPRTPNGYPRRGRRTLM